MDLDYDYDADPFADMDYESLLAWAEENRFLKKSIFLKIKFSNREKLVQ